MSALAPMKWLARFRPAARSDEAPTRLYRVEPLSEHRCDFASRHQVFLLADPTEARVVRASDALRAVEDFYDSMRFKTHSRFSVRVEQTREQLVVHKYGIAPASLEVMP